MWRSVALLAALTLGAEAADGPRPLMGGAQFQGANVRAMQADGFANPGLLWVARGEALWGERCASCHGAASSSMRGIAVRYPRFDPVLGRVVGLEQRINACVARSPGPRSYPWESEELLGLTAHVARQSAGMPFDVEVDGPGAATYAHGRELYFQRQGQLNLACTQCHDRTWGRTLLTETISQGHPADWPAYRLEWQTLGSLQRRLRACYFGVRAAIPDFGSPDLVALELYLADRARGLATSPPGVRK
jgi:L-cysteine S-thiosulfotransferase